MDSALPSVGNCTLVLGGSGFLGAQVLLAALVRAEATAEDRGASEPRVVSASREPGALSVPRRVREGFLERRLDVLREGEAERLLEELQPARIVLCTALSQIPECESYPVLARTLNADFPRRVSRFSAGSGARLVQVSTDLVFGDRAPPARGFREEDPVGPVSVYGRTKAEGERAVLEEDPRALVVRLPLLFGDSGGRGLGASDRVLAAIARGERPAMFTDEFRTPLEVRSAAAALVELAWSRDSGILHVAGRERVSRFDLASAVLDSNELEPDRIRASTRTEAGLAATRPADVSLDARRAREFLRTPLVGVRAAFA
jgi:dTDP-4-dehydrorhamnose reductase